MTCEEFHALRGKVTSTNAECAAWIYHLRTCAACRKAAEEHFAIHGSKVNVQRVLARRAAVLSDPEAAAVLKDTESEESSD